MTFAARYPGRCAECGEPFEVGDQIRSTHYSQGVYVHALCPDTPDDKPTKFQGTTLDDMGY